MRFFQTIKLAIKNIRSNKLRSALTMIGIIIGISSVIVLVGMGSGSTKQITSQVQSLGTNLISANTSSNGNKQFTLDDVKNIEEIQGVDKVAPIISTSTTVKVDKNSQSTSVTGTTSNFLDIRNMSISEGRFIADLDVDYRGKVAVLGSEVLMRSLMLRSARSIPTRNLCCKSSPTARTLRLPRWSMSVGSDCSTFRLITSLTIRRKSSRRIIRLALLFGISMPSILFIL